MKDIFPLYVRNIKVIDTTEQERAIEAAKRANQERDQAQREKYKLSDELSRLKQQYCFTQVPSQSSPA